MANLGGTLQGEQEEWESKPAGTILRDWQERGVRAIIMRGPHSLCAYLGVPESHPVARECIGYDTLNDIGPFVHGGWTFGGVGEEPRPRGWYWFGWDYAHSGDQDVPAPGRSPLPAMKDGHKWTLAEVEAELRGVLPYFAQLMNFLASWIPEQLRVAGEDSR